MKKVKASGRESVVFHLDNYYKNHKDMPRTAAGKIDFDSPQALDLDLIKRSIKSLLAGEEVIIPAFDMKQGLRTAQTIALKLEEKQILVIEGTLALYPGISDTIAPERRLGIFAYASPNLKLDSGDILSSSDLRLIRRIVRDAKFRGYPAIHTIRQWPLVLAGEEKYIFSEITQTDMNIRMEDTYLPYELSILKTYALPLLEEAEAQTNSEDGQGTVKEIIRLKQLLAGIPDVSLADIPEDSILREFIGEKLDAILRGIAQPEKVNGNDPHRAKPGMNPTEEEIEKDMLRVKTLSDRTYITEVLNETINMVEGLDNQMARVLEEIRDSVVIRAGPFTRIYGTYRNDSLYLDSALLKPTHHTELVLTIFHEARVKLGIHDDKANEDYAQFMAEAIDTTSASHPLTRSIKERINKQIESMAEELEMSVDDHPFRDILLISEKLLSRIAKNLILKITNPVIAIRTFPVDAHKDIHNREIKIGIYPVAADPFHWAHLLAGLYAIAIAKLDKVIYIIAGLDARKPRLGKTQHHRHIMAKEVLAIFEPLFDYSPVALDTTAEGEENIFKILGFNPKHLIEAHYIVGADHYHRYNPKGDPDTIQKLEDNRARELHGFNKAFHRISPLFIERGKRGHIIETSLAVKFIPELSFECSSTMIRNAFQGSSAKRNLAIVPYIAYQYSRKNKLYDIDQDKPAINPSSSPIGDTIEDHPYELIEVSNLGIRRAG